MQLHFGNNIDYLKTIPRNSVDSVVTDPPYGISFMNRKWDYQVPSVETWKEVFRVLKPGGHMLVACGTRTQHRMVVNIEDAGFEIRDVICWHYGSGFPKSLNISKAIDNKLGYEPVIVGTGISGAMQNGSGQNTRPRHENNKNEEGRIEFDITEPVSDEAKQWSGFGTALKPAVEFFTLCRKPLSEPTVAENVMKFGTGGINIDASRIATDEISKGKYGDSEAQETHQTAGQQLGRFPSNVIFSHHEDCSEDGDCLMECPVRILNEQSGIRKSGAMKKAYLYTNTGTSIGKPTGSTKTLCKASEGYASRFFYTAKASRSERNYGLPEGVINDHPTVKPVKLMEYLINLTTPAGGLVADPFMGSGTTGIAAVLNGFDFIGMELEERSYKVAETRINFALGEYAES